MVELLTEIITSQSEKASPTILHVRCATLVKGGRIVAAFPDKVRYIELLANLSKILLWSNDSPGKEKEANWLLAPDGEFRVVLRIYRPGPKIVDQNLENATLEKTR